PNFFVPLHVSHLAEWCPAALKFLGLAPGWRFLIYEYTSSKSIGFCDLVNRAFDFCFRRRGGLDGDAVEQSLEGRIVDLDMRRAVCGRLGPDKDFTIETLVKNTYPGAIEKENLQSGVALAGKYK